MAPKWPQKAPKTAKTAKKALFARFPAPKSWGGAPKSGVRASQKASTRVGFWCGEKMRFFGGAPGAGNPVGPGATLSKSNV